MASIIHASRSQHWVQWPLQKLSAPIQWCVCTFCTFYGYGTLHEDSSCLILAIMPAWHMPSVAHQRVAQVAISPTFPNLHACFKGFCFAGESLWQLPLETRYRKMIDSPIADLKNYGGAPAGAITAALFLQEFVTSSVQWAHIDAGAFLRPPTYEALRLEQDSLCIPCLPLHEADHSCRSPFTLIPELFGVHLDNCMW